MLTHSELEVLMDQIRDGRRDAFRPIVRAYSLALRSYIASQVHHHNDVDDIAQEVFLAAYRHLDTFRRGDNFEAWLRGIARNKLLDYFRSSVRRNKVLERFREDVARIVQEDLERAASADHSDSIEALLRCIARLPEKLRRVVRGGLDGDKPAELAEEFLTTVGAIYTMHYRANQLLRECVRKELS